MRFSGPARRELHRWTANVRSKSSRRRTCVTLTSRNQPSVVRVVFRYPYIPHLVRRQNVDLDVDYATTLVAAVLLGIGFVLQQCVAQQEPESLFLSPRILTDLLRKPRWLIGIGCMVAGQLLAAYSIGHAALTLVEPLLTTYLLFALLLAVPMSKQAMRWTEVAGALLLCAGVALLSLSRSTKPIGLSFGSFSHWYAAAIIAGVAYVAVLAAVARRGPARATLIGRSEERRVGGRRRGRWGHVHRG